MDEEKVLETVSEKLTVAATGFKAFMATLESGKYDVVDLASEMQRVGWVLLECADMINAKAEEIERGLDAEEACGESKGQGIEAGDGPESSGRDGSAQVLQCGTEFRAQQAQEGSVLASIGQDNASKVIKCQACGVNMTDPSGESLIGINLRVMGDHSEAKRFIAMFGSDVMNVCICCLGKALGLKPV